MATFDVLCTPRLMVSFVLCSWFRQPHTEVLFHWGAKIRTHPQLSSQFKIYYLAQYRQIAVFCTISERSKAQYFPPFFSFLLSVCFPSALRASNTPKALLVLRASTSGGNHLPWGLYTHLVLCFIKKYTVLESNV